MSYKVPPTLWQVCMPFVIGLGALVFCGALIAFGIAGDALRVWVALKVLGR